jgi:hypothetical protein
MKLTHEQVSANETILESQIAYQARRQSATPHRVPANGGYLPLAFLASSFVAGVQPARAVAAAATSRSFAPGPRTRITLFPIVNVESAPIDSDASLPCDHLSTLSVDEV